MGIEIEGEKYKTAQLERIQPLNKILTTIEKGIWEFNRPADSIVPDAKSGRIHELITLMKTAGHYAHKNATDVPEDDKIKLKEFGLKIKKFLANDRKQKEQKKADEKNKEDNKPKTNDKEKKKDAVETNKNKMDT